MRQVLALCDGCGCSEINAENADLYVDTLGPFVNRVSGWPTVRDRI